MTIEEAIRSFAKKEIKIQVRLCTVTSVNENKACCNVKTDEGIELFEVRLKSIITNGDEGIITIPKVGSFVLVGIIKNIETMHFICGFSEVASYKIKCSDSGVIRLNGDDYEMVKAIELKKELGKLKGTLDAIILAINTPVLTASPGSPDLFQTALKAAIVGKTTGDFSGINNNKVKHG